MANLILPAALDAYVACYRAPTCGSDDQCGLVAGRAVAGAAGDAYKADCLQKWQTCVGSGVGRPFLNDFCDQSMFASGADIAVFTDCMQKPCAEIDACFRALPSVVRFAECKKK